MQEPEDEKIVEEANPVWKAKEPPKVSVENPEEEERKASDVNRMP